MHSGVAQFNPLNPFNEQDALSLPEKELIQTEVHISHSNIIRDVKMYVQETYNEQLNTLIEVFLDPLQRWLSNFDSDLKAKQRPDYVIEAAREELELSHSDIVSAIFSNIRLCRFTMCILLFSNLFHQATVQLQYSFAHSFERSVYKRVKEYCHRNLSTACAVFKNVTINNNSMYHII